MILEFLLSNRIRPVIIEAPDVYIWKSFEKRSLKYLLIDYLRSIMTGCEMYHYAEYREALNSMIIERQLMDSIVYVGMNSWNHTSPQIEQRLFLDDQLHLNRDGYERMDFAIASEIANDYLKRKQK